MNWFLTFWFSSLCVLCGSVSFYEGRVVKPKLWRMRVSRRRRGGGGTQAEI
jgi:hypothetical protein